MGAKHGFNLAQLDTEAADFDLMIFAAQILDPPTRPPPPYVARRIQSSARFFGKWVGDEARSRQVGSMQIAARQPGSGNVDFSRDAERRQLQMVVENINLQVRNRLADDAPSGIGDVLHGQSAVGGVDGRLGDAVHINQLRQPGPVARDPGP